MQVGGNIFGIFSRDAMQVSVWEFSITFDYEEVSTMIIRMGQAMQ